MLDLIVVPSLLGFLIKLYFLYISRSSITKNNFSALLLICALHSLCECVTLISLSFGNDVELLFRMYYVLIIWWFGFSFVYATEIAKLDLKYRISSILVTVAISLLLLFTDLMISGYHSNGFSITANREELFKIAPIFVLSASISSIAVLFWVKRSDSFDTKNKIKAHYLLIALSVPIIVIVAVIVALSFHLKMNATIAFPVATTLFFIFIIKSERNHKMSDIARFNPFSLESKFAKEMNHIAKRFANDEIDHKQLKKESERASIKYALKINRNKSVVELSKQLGMPPSTLYSVIKRYGLEVNHKKETKKV